MYKVFMALLLGVAPAYATEVSVSCHITDEAKFMSDVSGTPVSYSDTNPLTIENFTIVDNGIKGFPQGEATPDHANGISEMNGIKRTVSIDRKTGSLMEILEFAPMNGYSSRWVINGTCQKAEAF